MPTERHRYMITETEDVRSALATAARQWPGETPSQLLQHLIEAGRRALQGDVERRRRAIVESAGMFSDFYPPDYVERLHAEWPE